MQQWPACGLVKGYGQPWRTHPLCTLSSQHTWTWRVTQMVLALEIPCLWASLAHRRPCGCALPNVGVNAHGKNALANRAHDGRVQASTIVYEHFCETIPRVSVLQGNARLAATGAQLTALVCHCQAPGVVQGACTSPAAGQTPPGIDPARLREEQCVIDGQDSLFAVRAADTGDIPEVWMHNLYLRLLGPAAQSPAGTDDSAALQLNGSQTWLTSITVVGTKPSSRGLSLTASDLYAAGTTPPPSVLPRCPPTAHVDESPRGA